jgi:hypothetical protein
MQEIMEGLSFLLDDFDEICRSAHAKYRAYPADVLVDHDARAAATCTYSHIAAAASARLGQYDNVKLLDERQLGGLKVWRVGDFAVFRFKKHDEDGRGRNYPTKQAEAYDKGLSLPGLPAPAVRLSVGYWLDPTGIEFHRTQVARPMGGLIDWCAAIVPVPERKEDAPRWVDVTRQPHW